MNLHSKFKYYLMFVDVNCLLKLEYITSQALSELCFIVTALFLQPGWLRAWSAPGRIISGEWERDWREIAVQIVDRDSGADSRPGSSRAKNISQITGGPIPTQGPGRNHLGRLWTVVSASDQRPGQT